MAFFGDIDYNYGFTFKFIEFGETDLVSYYPINPFKNYDINFKSKDKEFHMLQLKCSHLHKVIDFEISLISTDFSLTGIHFKYASNYILIENDFENQMEVKFIENNESFQINFKLNGNENVFKFPKDSQFYKLLNSIKIMNFREYDNISLYDLLKKIS